MTPPSAGTRCAFVDMDRRRCYRAEAEHVPGQAHAFVPPKPPAGEERCKACGKLKTWCDALGCTSYDGKTARRLQEQGVTLRSAPPAGGPAGVELDRPDAIDEIMNRGKAPAAGEALTADEWMTVDVTSHRKERRFYTRLARYALAARKVIEEAIERGYGPDSGMGGVHPDDLREVEEWAARARALAADRKEEQEGT